MNEQEKLSEFDRNAVERCINKLIAKYGDQAEKEKDQHLNSGGTLETLVHSPEIRDVKIKIAMFQNMIFDPIKSEVSKMIEEEKRAISLEEAHKISKD